MPNGGRTYINHLRENVPNKPSVLRGSEFKGNPNVSNLEEVQTAPVGTFYMQFNANNMLWQKINISTWERVGKDVFDELYENRFPPTYIHEQQVPMDFWEINHKMNKHPSVTVVDSAGTVVVGEVQYVNKNELSIQFKSEFSGRAYLN